MGETGAAGMHRRFRGTLTGALALAVVVVCLLVPGAAHASARAAAGGRWSHSDLAAVASACARAGTPCPSARALLGPGLRAGRAARRAGAHPAIVAPGAITGTVTDASTKSGLGEIEVCAYEQHAFEEGFEEEEEPEAECAYTEAGGEYEIGELPPGDYVVEFFDPERNYVTQIYNGKTIAQEPTPVTVSAGATTEHIDAALLEGGRIEGTVKAAATKLNLQGFAVCALGIASFGCAETGPEGKYLIKGLAGGNYTVLFLVPRLPGDNYLLKVQEKVVVHLKETTHNVNAELQTGGEIRGTVRKALNGAPLAGAEICAFAFFEEPPEECTVSGIGGGYLMERLPTGSYFVEFWDEPLYITQFYAGSPVRAGATAVPVTAGGAPAEPIDASLHTAAPEQGPLPVVVPPVPQPAPAAPTISVLTSKTVIPSIAILGRLKDAGHFAKVKLRCGVGPCKGTLKLIVTVTKRRHVGGHTVTRHVTEVLGTASFSLAQGESATVKIQLSAAGRRLLANSAHHPHAAKLKLAMQGAQAAVRAVVVG